MDLKPCAYQIVACNMYNIEFRNDDFWTQSGHDLFDITREKNVNRLVAGGFFNIRFCPCLTVGHSDLRLSVVATERIVFLTVRVSQSTNNQRINQAINHQVTWHSYFHVLFIGWNRQRPSIIVWGRDEYNRVKSSLCSVRHLGGRGGRGGDLYHPHFSIMWRSQRLSLTLQTQGVCKVKVPAHNVCAILGCCTSFWAERH